MFPRTTNYFKISEFELKYKYKGNIVITFK